MGFLHSVGELLTALEVLELRLVAFILLSVFLWNTLKKHLH